LSNRRSWRTQAAEVSQRRAAELIAAAREYSTAAVMLHGAVAARFGLSATDLKALDLLQRLGPVAAGEIARHTGLAAASVTSLIDRLADKRLVVRKRDPGDRRRVVVVLTARVATSIAPLFQALNRRLRDRCRRYGAGEAALIRGFLTAAARDLRDQASGLTRARAG